MESRMEAGKNAADHWLQLFWSTIEYIDSTQIFQIPTTLVFLFMIATQIAYFTGSLVHKPLAPVQGDCWRDTICTNRTPAFPGPWENHIYAPKSRTISPLPSAGTLSSNGSLVVYDFGKEVGGIIRLTYKASGSGTVGLAFSEAKNWTGEASDGSNGAYHPGGDGALFFDFTSTTKGAYTMPDAQLRGGFRYMSVFVFTKTKKPINVEITSIDLEIAFQPTWPDLRAYGGYFHSNDELLNRIWYAGAYTLQTNSIPPRTGRVFPLLEQGWRNDAYLGTSGPSILVDGSKRDRATWSGDLGIALPSVFVSTGDFESAKNALQLQFDLQRESGELPMAGPPINFYGSDTYHLSSIIGTYEYILYSGDMAFLNANWEKLKLAILWITNKIDDSGLLYVTGAADWGRLTQGGYNTGANAMMYRSLITGSIMANWTNEPTWASKWTAQAAKIKTVINSPKYNWDSLFGAFKDTPTSSLHPQDGNSLSLYYSLANSSLSPSISTSLLKNWGPLGAICPELPSNIVPYIESIEIKAHFSIFQSLRALSLVRLSWGWYLNNPFGTESTFLEGYLSDGSFGYRTTAYGNDASYTSHAHGWSTGPTHALSYYVLGIQLTQPGGGEWVLAPQFGDLTEVEGGFSAGRGKFWAGWKRNEEGYVLGYEMPEGTRGKVVLPAGVDKVPRVVVDGVVVVNGMYDAVLGVVKIEGRSGGKGEIVVTY